VRRRHVVVNKLRGTLHTCAVKAPGLATRKAMLEDISVLTAARPSRRLGIKLENIKVTDLGRAKKVGRRQGQHDPRRGAGKTKEIEGRIKQIRAQIEETTSDYDREKLQERWRTGRRVGGHQGGAAPRRR